jgi:hypothetical protein
MLGPVAPTRRFNSPVETQKNEAQNNSLASEVDEMEREGEGVSAGSRDERQGRRRHTSGKREGAEIGRVDRVNDVFLRAIGLITQELEASPAGTHRAHTTRCVRHRLYLTRTRTS